MADLDTNQQSNQIAAQQSPQTTNQGDTQQQPQEQTVPQQQQLQSKPQNQPVVETTKESDITKITIILPTNAYFMSGIRDFTLSLIKNMTDFSEQWAYRFQSVVDELCNNAIEHGSAKKNEEIKIIFLTKERKYVQIVVEDSGTGPKKISAFELSKLVEQRKNQDYSEIGIRGRGLAKIVAEWTDELKFEDIETGGIRVIVKKYLNNPEIEKDISQMKGQVNLPGREPIGQPEKIVLET